MNTRQKNILESWHQVLWSFTKREWFSLLLWSGLGVLAAESVDLLLRDHAFQRYLLSNYKPNVSFDDPKHYAPYVAIVLVTMFLAVIAYISAYVRRGLKSWRAGAGQAVWYYCRLSRHSSFRSCHPRAFTIA